VLGWLATRGAWVWAVREAVFGPATLETCLMAQGACWSFLKAMWRLILIAQFTFKERWRATLVALSMLLRGGALGLAPVLAR